MGLKVFIEAISAQIIFYYLVRIPWCLLLQTNQVSDFPVKVRATWLQTSYNCENIKFSEPISFSLDEIDSGFRYVLFSGSRTAPDLSSDFAELESTNNARNGFFILVNFHKVVLFMATTFGSRAYKYFDDGRLGFVQYGRHRRSSAWLPRKNW